MYLLYYTYNNSKFLLEKCIVFKLISGTNKVKFYCTTKNTPKISSFKIKKLTFMY